MKTRWWSYFLLLILLTACAPEKGVRDWTSIPSVQAGQNRFFDVRFEPLKRDKRFFVLFRLDVTNKTDQELIIDWNKTRYFYNGQENGPFVFKGIDPATIQNAIPPDTIAPGGTFSREIFPANLVAFAPMREEVLDKKGKGLFPGPIPAGENGIRLVVGQNGKEIVQKLTVEIR
jgi:hypothetical protein